MKLQDDLYGEFEVQAIITDLLATKAIQRLKEVHQAGAAYLVNSAWNITRYEHSVGVMLLIRRLGGSLEEQVAGLLHDVSHTAFSHAVDFALNVIDQDYHDSIFEEVILNSEIPSILLKYNMDPKQVLNIVGWGLLEQPLPDLCADRIDYTLRDMYHYFQIPLPEIQSFLDSLVLVQGKICVSSTEMARWFTALYYKEVIDFFLSPINVYAYHRLGQIMRLALERSFISLNDLLLEDTALLTLLEAIQDHDIKSLLDQLMAPIQLTEDNDQADFHLVGKRRIIDVPVSLDGRSYRAASLLCNEIKDMNDRAIIKSQQGTYVRILK